MGIAHGYRNATHFRGAGFQDHLGLDRGFSHFSFKFELKVASGGQNADLGSRPGQDCDALFPLRGADVGGDAAGAVAGNLRWRAVGVDQTDFEIRRKVRRHPFHTVGANAASNDHDPFIQKYIFPSSNQPRLSEIAGGLERNGLAILDVENMIRHYAHTAARWLENFRARRARLDVNRYDETFQRMWEFYLCGAVAAARASNAALYQVLFAKDYAAPIPLQRV